MTPENRRSAGGRARRRRRDQRAGLSPRDAGLRRSGPVARRPLSRLAGDVLADGGAAGALHHRHAAGARAERRHPGSPIAGAGGGCTAARFFGRNNARLILLLIVLYKLGDAFAMSLTTTFLIRGVGFDAGEVGMVNKTLGLFATILGALYGGVLMQRLTLFRALLIFGLLQGSPTPATGCCRLPISTSIPWRPRYSLRTCAGMGTAAFVALLMTLCNKSFSATQFALLSALSAVGRVYVGPIAGWFVEAHGWSTFYLFSVVAAVPGSRCCCCAGKRSSIPNARQALYRVANIRRPMRWRWDPDAGLPAAGGMAGSADPQRAGLYVVQLPVRPAGGCRADGRWRYFARRPARLRRCVKPT